jgi:hypothetical protein
VGGWAKQNMKKKEERRQRRSRMGRDAEEKKEKKKRSQGVQHLNLGCSISFESVEYIYIYKFFFCTFLKNSSIFLKKPLVIILPKSLFSLSKPDTMSISNH